MAIQRVSAPQAVNLQKVGYVIVDVSAPDEYRRGHPAGAVNVPHRFFGAGGDLKPNPDFARVMQAVFPKDKPLLIVAKIGKRSLEAAEELEALGYTALVELRPGFKGIINGIGRYDEDGWENLGLPIETVTDGGSYDELKARAGLGS